MEKKEQVTLGTREKSLIRIISDLRGGLLHVLKNEDKCSESEQLQDLIKDISNLKNSSIVLSKIKEFDFKSIHQNSGHFESLLNSIQKQKKSNLPDNIKHRLQKLEENILNDELDINEAYMEYFDISQKISNTLSTLRDTDNRVKNSEHFENFQEGVDTVLESDLVIASRNMANSIQRLIKKINQSDNTNPEISELSNEAKTLSQGKAKFFGGLDLLSRVTELVVKMKFDEQEKYKQHFLNLQEKLEDISSIINFQASNNESMKENEDKLSNDFHSNLKNLKNDTQDAESIDDLKNIVFSNIENIEGRLKDFKDKQISLRQKANKEVNRLKSQISSLTEEQKKLEEAIEEKDKQMIIDDLTSIYNKIGYEKEIEDRYKWWKKNPDEELSLAVIDIDHFKSINDKLGHDIGDLILREVAQTLKRIVGPKGTAFRWGGEEFVVIIPDLNLKTSIELIKKVRLYFENNPVKIINHAPVPVTISGGIASFHKETDTPKTVFKKADNALYFSKNNGRNKISFYKVKK